MAEIPEKRGPIEKGEKGWPINPLGVVALVIFAVVAAFLIAKPILKQRSPGLNEQTISSGGRIITPAAGDIIRSDKISIELSVDEPQKVVKVLLWAKTYADGRWQMIGEITSAPYRFDWSIPSQFQNKAIVLTAHIYQKDGRIIKDPGGWREGIIILNP